jgi:hypothetical protein
MASTRIYFRSFAGGEMSPEMFGRVDDVKYQTGAARMRNFIAVPQGPAENRPGTRFVREVKDSTKRTRLIPFTYSTTQTMAIEMGAGYFRFHTQGATLTPGTPSAYVVGGTTVTVTQSTQAPVTFAQPKSNTVTISIASPAQINWNSHGLQDGDVVTFTTTGALPTGLSVGTKYYVLAVATNHFHVALTPGGTAINTSGTQSGTHTAATATQVRWTGHGLASGQELLFSTTVTLPTGLSTNTSYYVVDPATDTFRIAATVGGTAISTTTAGTGIHTASTPAIINWSSHGLANGTAIGFTTTGTLPAGMASDTVYYVNTAATNTFQISATSGGPSVVTTTAGSGTHTASFPYTVGSLVSHSGTNYYCIATAINKTPPNATYWYPLPAGVYEIPNPYAEADLFDIHYVQSADVLTLVHPNYAPRELRRLGATTWVLSPINFAAPLSAPTNVNADKTGTSTTTYTYTYVVTAVDADLISESQQSASVSVDADFGQVGEFITVSWASVAGAARYRVYKLQGGLYGFIGETAGTSIVDDNIAPDLGITPPIYDTVFASSGNYPGAVSYFEQRRIFAGTNNAPQTLLMTRSGTESDMSYSIPTEDTDRIKFRVAAREANTIRHIVPLTQLLALTSAAEWRISPVNSDVITPTTISVRPQSYIGANNVQPSIVNNTVIYCAARGGHVRELGYSWQASGFVTGDLSLRSAHLFDNLEISDMCYSKSPQPLLWFVSSSGYLLGLTYVPEQQVAAWHWHDTDGSYESCTAIAEGSEDALYVIVKRTINSVTKRYVERFQTRQVTELSDCFFVDCGLSYDGTNTTATTVTVTGGTTWGPADTLTVTASSALFVFPGTSDVGDAIVLTGGDGTQYRLTILSTTSTTVATARVDKVIPAAIRGVATTVWAFARNSFSGLTHLEGKTVSILADGAVQPQETVTSGSITLDRAFTVIQVGLPYESDLQTLPLTINIDGAGQGRRKNINKATLRVFQSSGIFVGPDADNLVEAKQRTNEPYGSPPALKSDEVDVDLLPKWANSGQVFIRQVDPLPLSVVGLTLEVVIGG